MNILIQVDSDVHNSKALDGIVGYKQGGYAVSKAGDLAKTNRGVRKVRQTKIGWTFLIQWKYGTKTWMPLNILKGFNPVDVVEFLVERSI